MLAERSAQVTREEDRIRELVESITLANGTNEVLALAGELKVLVDARNKRLNGNQALARPVRNNGGPINGQGESSRLRAVLLR